MKNYFVFAFFLTGMLLSAQNNSRLVSAGQVAPGAQAQLGALLNNPTMIRPATATPLGRNWFRLEIDTHVLTDQVSVKQVAAVFTDWNNQEKHFTGKKAILSASVAGTEDGKAIVDFISTSFAPMGIRIRTPYRAAITIFDNSESRSFVEMMQTDSDSASNDRIKDSYSARYAQNVTIDGKTYTYIRICNINNVNGSILPGARGVLESQAAPANIEALHLIIAAAKTKI